LSRQRLVVLSHEFRSNLAKHPERGLVVHADLAFELLRGDPALGAGHKKDRVEPQVQRGRGLVENRPGRRVDVVATAGASPRLAALRSLVALEAALLFALRAVSMLAIGREAVAPQPFQTGRVVRKLALELHEGDS